MAVLEKIGYIINESAVAGFETTNVVKEENGKIVAEGCLQVAEELNRNGRIYPSSELFPQLQAPRLLELLETGYLRAELGHPLSADLVRQQTIDDSRTTAMFLKLWTEGNEIWGRFRGTNNAFGAAFDADLRDGCKPAWSLRALGTLVKEARGNVVRNLKIITWDQVIYPSHPSAYTRRLITEATNVAESLNEGKYGNDLENNAKVVPFDNESVIRYIMAESANIKYIKELFDFAYDNISIDESAKKVVLTCNDGNVLVVTLEKYIGDEIRNYASSMNSLLG